MKKLIALILIFCLCIIMICSCKQEGAEEIDGSRFIIVWSEQLYDSSTDIDKARILVDKETGVMYLYVFHNQKAGLVVMVDENGKPLIWKGD